MKMRRLKIDVKKRMKSTLNHLIWNYLFSSVCCNNLLGAKNPRICVPYLSVRSKKKTVYSTVLRIFCNSSVNAEALSLQSINSWWSRPRKKKPRTDKSQGIHIRWREKNTLFYCLYSKWFPGNKNGPLFVLM